MQSVSGSASIRGTGRFGSVDVRTASGDVAFDELTGSASVKSASGDIRIGDVEGPATVATTSGDAEIRRAGSDLSAALVSGDLRVASVARGIKGRSVSGDLRIESFDRGRASLNTVSGDVEIARPARPARVDGYRLAFRRHVVRPGHDRWRRRGPWRGQIEIKAHSVSGDVRIRRACAQNGNVNREQEEWSCGHRYRWRCSAKSRRTLTVATESVRRQREARRTKGARDRNSLRGRGLGTPPRGRPARTPLPSANPPARRVLTFPAGRVAHSPLEVGPRAAGKG